MFIAIMCLLCVCTLHTVISVALNRYNNAQCVFHFSTRSAGRHYWKENGDFPTGTQHTFREICPDVDLSIPKEGDGMATDSNSSHQFYEGKSKLNDLGEIIIAYNSQ